MNNKTIVVGIVVLVIFGGWWFVSNQQSQKTEQAKMAQEKAAMKAKEDAVMGQKETPEQQEMEKKAAMEKKDGDKMVKSNSSRYVEYSKAVLDQSADKRRVLYFYATWCPSCKVANEDFTANPNKIPEDVVVLRVNYNDPDTDQEEKDLAKKYGITYQHTFVQVDSTGKEITKWNGGQTEELLTKLK
ncbi:MAG: thioredoxin domain-containing protein [Patescibacteria group bacterium]